MSSRFVFGKGSNPLPDLTKPLPPPPPLPPLAEPPAYVCEQCGRGLSSLPPPDFIMEMKPRILCPICLSGAQVNQENGKTGKPEEMYRVRRINDGYYLTENTCCAHGQTVSMRWFPDKVRSPGEWPREQAMTVAAAMMILCADSGIEIVPA